ncbi:MAG: nucleotide sugar dehydrogenase [bacterium]
MTIKISVIGLGYVGLPLALALSRHYSVLGFDLNEERINSLKNAKDMSAEIDPREIENSSLGFTCSIDDLSDSNLYIITVPTPIDSHNNPDLSMIRSATSMVATSLNKGDCVVYESTVFPGVTEDICAPILEKISGLTYKKDFHLGYSPERLSPGKGGKTLEEVVKVVSASCSDTLSMLSKIYKSVVPAGVYEADSIKVAEAAKVLENTQRDLNIALMNELSKICHLIDIDTKSVIDTAASKWNFMKVYPGLVGGHCIGVDPYYLTHLALQKNYAPEVILAGRRINNSMAKFVVDHCVKALSTANKSIHSCRVLVLGLSFKENIQDIRNSKIPDLIDELSQFGITPTIHDPLVSAKEAKSMYDIRLSPLDLDSKYDAIILAVPHKELVSRPLRKWLSFIDGKKIFIDITGFYKKDSVTFSSLYYWSL